MPPPGDNPFADLDPGPSPIVTVPAPDGGNPFADLDVPPDTRPAAPFGLNAWTSLQNADTGLRRALLAGPAMVEGGWRHVLGMQNPDPKSAFSPLARYQAAGEQIAANERALQEYKPPAGVDSLLTQGAELVPWVAAPEVAATNLATDTQRHALEAGDSNLSASLQGLAQGAVGFAAPGAVGKFAKIPAVRAVLSKLGAGATGALLKMGVPEPVVGGLMRTMAASAHGGAAAVPLGAGSAGVNLAAGHPEQAMEDITNIPASAAALAVLSGVPHAAREGFAARRAVREADRSQARADILTQPTEPLALDVPAGTRGFPTEIDPALIAQARAAALQAGPGPKQVTAQDIAAGQAPRGADLALEAQKLAEAEAPPPAEQPGIALPMDANLPPPARQMRPDSPAIEGQLAKALLREGEVVQQLKAQRVEDDAAAMEAAQTASDAQAQAQREMNAPLAMEQSVEAAQHEPVQAKLAEARDRLAAASQAAEPFPVGARPVLEAIQAEGGIKSRSRAIAEGIKPGGEYDDVAGIPKAAHGAASPDVVATELHRNGVIPAPTVQAMVKALQVEEVAHRRALGHAEAVKKAQAEYRMAEGAAKQAGVLKTEPKAIPGDVAPLRSSKEAIPAIPDVIPKASTPAEDAATIPGVRRGLRPQEIADLPLAERHAHVAQLAPQERARVSPEVARIIRERQPSPEVEQARQAAEQRASTLAAEESSTEPIQVAHARQVVDAFEAGKKSAQSKPPSTAPMQANSHENLGSAETVNRRAGQESSGASPEDGTMSPQMTVQSFRDQLTDAYARTSLPPERQAQVVHAAVELVHASARAAGESPDAFVGKRIHRVEGQRSLPEPSLNQSRAKSDTLGQPESTPALDGAKSGRLNGSPLGDRLVAITDNPDMAAQAARELYRLAVAGGGSKRGFVYGTASPDLIKAARARGVNISADAWLVIDADGIRHAIKKHGGAGESDRGQLPITAETFARLTQVPQNEWSVIGTGKDSTGQPVIVLRSKDGLRVAEAVLRGGRRLMMRTVYEKENDRRSVTLGSKPGSSTAYRSPDGSLTPENRENKQRPDTLDQGKRDKMNLSHHGNITFINDGRALIRILQSGNESTILHELGHMFRRYLKPEDLAVAERALGVSGGKWGRTHEERFARSFERWTANGESPTAPLAGVFQKFKQWLSDVYNGITGSAIDVKVSPALDRVFKNIFTEGKGLQGEYRASGREGDLASVLAPRAKRSTPGETRTPAEPTRSSSIEPTERAPAVHEERPAPVQEQIETDNTSVQPGRTESVATGESVTGIKNDVSAADRERLGLPPRDTPEARTFEEMYDAGKAKAASDPLAVDKLLSKLRKDPERIVSSDEEAGLLLKHKVDLENKFQRLRKEAAAAMAAGDANGHLIAKAELDAHREMLKEFADLMERSGTAAGRALVARKMMSSMDYSLSHMEATAEAAKGSGLSERELSKIDLLHQEFAEKSAAAEKALAAYQARLGKKIDDYSAKLESGDFSRPEKRKRPQYDAETLRLQAELEGVKRRWNAELRLFEHSKRNLAQKAGHALAAAPGFFKSVKASLDNSAVFRQGWRVMFTNPVIWQRNARKTFSDMWKTLGGKEVMDEIHAEMRLSPYYEQAKQAKLAIKTTEDDFPTAIPGRIPGLGRIYKASENAFTGFQYRNRMQVFEKMMDIATKSGVDITDPKQLRSIGALVNSLTSRGALGKLEPMGNILNNVFFSARKIKADWDFLTAHSADMDMTSFARKQAAQNLAKVIGGTALIMLIAKSLDPDSVELDPRSADFGKIKVGNTRFDISGGASPTATLAARLATMSTKSTKSGKVNPLNSGAFGSQTGAGIIETFFANKLSPVASVVLNHLRGRQFDGEKPTLSSDAYDLLMPMAIANFIELQNDTKASPESVGAGVAADYLGIGVNTYDGKNKKQSGSK